MTPEHLFTQALGFNAPWKVVSANFDPDAKSLELVIDFETGSKFPDPTSDSNLLCPVHDTVQRTWQHLNFFEHTTTLRARVPRIKTPDGAVKNIQVPWARPQSGFTLLLEAYILMLAKVLPVTEVSKQTNVSQARIWHLIRSHISEAWKKTIGPRPTLQWDREKDRALPRADASEVKSKYQIQPAPTSAVRSQ